MGIPTNIETLLSGTTVESVRLEFKKGWNPEPILHTICAFANDINDLGGGYILIGVEEEKGKPKRPIEGLNISSIDSIQKELLQNCKLITPSYIPVVEPVIYENKNILIVWCPSGYTRPYKCPVNLDKEKSKNYAYYIRKMSSTIKATNEDEKELFSLASHIPFDDRINHTAEIGDLKFGLIQAYLYEIKSDLYKESENMKFVDLCKSMRIVGGPTENIRPLNVGLMFFNNEPQNFFPYTQIEIVDLRNGPEGDDMKEKIFKGPIDQMLRNALNFIKDLIIIEKIEKVDFQAEAIRYFNYPYQAIEEALANAIYHRRI
jgi:ATP-dependent DNA helicase RecG